MARLLSDQSKLVFLYESGTYANISGAGQWPGMVQEHSIIENQNVIENRFLGLGVRNIGTFENGPLDIEGDVTLFPQDWRLLGYTLGSISTTSGTSQSSNYRHSISTVNSNTRHNAFTSGTFNPFISFALEESRTSNITNQNHMRTLRGCVINNYQLNIAQGNPIETITTFIAQGGSWFSGTSTTVTAGSNRPYLWSDTVFSLPTSSTQESVKSLTLNINNNLTAPHYLNGSRVIQVPYPGNFDCNLDITQDLDSTTAGSLYDTYFLGGSTFNCELDINNTINTGSHRLTVYFSGCRITTLEVPATIGGVSEINYTVVAGSVSAIAHDRQPFYTPF